MASRKTADFEFKIEGIDKMIASIKKAGQLGVDAANRGVEQFAQFVGTEAMKIIPFDQGGLLDSYVRDIPMKNGEKIIGFNIAYAARQHEDVTLNHPGVRSKHPVRGAQGRPKYLEDPMKQHASKMKDFVADEVNKVL